jgi:hypothetical protein
MVPVDVGADAEDEDFDDVDRCEVEHCVGCFVAGDVPIVSGVVQDVVVGSGERRYEDD